MGTYESSDGSRANRGQAGTTTTMRWVIAAVGAVAVAGLGWAVWTTTLGGSSSGMSLEDRSTSASASASPPVRSGASPGATPVAGSEVQVPDPAATDTAQLPARTSPTPLVAAPLPPDASLQGGLVENFPNMIAGVTEASDVIDSSITSDGETLLAAVNARTDETPTEIADHYRQVWNDAGLSPVAGRVDLAFSDQYSSATLSTRESGTGTLYTVYVTLRVG